MIKPILQLGDPLLRRKAVRIAKTAGIDLKPLLDDMLATLADSRGVGIAAPQIGESVRLVIIASQSNDRYPDAPDMAPLPMINPRIEWASPETEKDWEGCLSIPGIRGIVPRNSRILVRYQRFPDRVEVIEAYEGFEARIVQHELDHLDGKLFIDRVESTHELATEQEYGRIVGGDEED
jgi:peptide deformylase